MRICSFSTEITHLGKTQRTDTKALLALSANPKISTWDMEEEGWLRDLIKSLKDQNLIIELKADYPFHKYQLTDAGKALIGE